jgi:hypothetical protein
VADQEKREEMEEEKYKDVLAKEAGDAAKLKETFEKARFQLRDASSVKSVRRHTSVSSF